MTRLEWGGVAADYDEAERAVMRQLADDGDTANLRLIHEAKAWYDARLVPDAPEGEAVRACGIAAHAGQTWTNLAGRPVCLICHPPVV